MVASVLSDEVDDGLLDGVLQVRPDLDKVGQIRVIFRLEKQAGRKILILGFAAWRPFVCKWFVRKLLWNGWG